MEDRNGKSFRQVGASRHDILDLLVNHNCTMGEAKSQEEKRMPR